MLLVIDIGNTNITLGVFDKESLIKTYRIASDKNMQQSEYERLLSELLTKHKITDCIIGSVVTELNSIIQKACNNIFNINSLLLDSTLDYGLEVKLQNPQEVGADRIANAYAAKKLYSLPAIVVDIGTATTFDIVSKEGNFLGGVIMPGINLQFKSLYSNTSKLPKIHAQKSNKAIGNSTENAMLSGIIRGSASSIEGLIHQCELELGQRATIIATGGDSKLISEYMLRSFDYVNPTLTLEGLKYLYELNLVRKR